VAKCALRIPCAPIVVFTAAKKLSAKKPKNSKTERAGTCPFVFKDYAGSISGFFILNLFIRFFMGVNPSFFCRNGDLFL
jgi:hypothetical protein